MVHGFSVIKNKIITPLLLASERVIEYMIPDRDDKPTKSFDESHSAQLDNDNDSLNKESIILEDKLSKMTLEDERKMRKRTLKLLRKSNQNVKISNNLIQKASDCVDFISERAPVESKVTRNFVTNMIELSDSAVQRLSTTLKGVDGANDIVNLRFIKPSKKFYNLLMAVWVKLDYRSIFTLNELDFVESVKRALTKESQKWSDSYIKPTTTFFNIAKEEFIKLYRIQKDDAHELDEEPKDFEFSMSQFFTTMKSGLLEMWKSEIVDKSSKFTFATSAKESETKSEKSSSEPKESDSI